MASVGGERLTTTEVPERAPGEHDGDPTAVMPVDQTAPDPNHALPAPGHLAGDGPASFGRSTPPPPTSRAGSWIRTIIIVLVIAVAVAAAIWKVRANRAAQMQQAQMMAAAADRPVPVSITPVQQRTMPIYLTALGTVTAYNTVTVHSRVDGQLVRVLFREGQTVHKGELLAEIDPRPYQAALEQAEGQLVKDEANAKNADAEAARYTALFKAGVVSKESQQAQVSTAGQATGSLQADRAAIDAAKVNLIYTRITSPINGVVGLRQIDAGNIVHAADTNGLVIITQLEPISVIFTLTEDTIPRVLQMVRAGRRLVVEAYDRADTTHLGTGNLLTLDNQIDTTTGTDKVKAVFPNTDHALFPNQFVNVRLVLENRPNALVIPAAAVQTGSQGNYVYVMRNGNPPEELQQAQAASRNGGKGVKLSGSDDADTESSGTRQAAHYVIAQPIKIDTTEGTSVIVDQGLQAGDQIVIDGQEKLRNGSRVIPHAARSTASPSAAVATGNPAPVTGPDSNSYSPAGPVRPREPRLDERRRRRPGSDTPSNTTPANAQPSGEGSHP